MKRADSVKYPQPGLRVRCERGVDPGIRQSCLNFQSGYVQRWNSL